MSESNPVSQVQKTFDIVAKSYDHPGSSWFDRTASAICQAAELEPGQSALDLATGTGKVAIELAATSPESTVLGFDLSSGMLAEAKQKALAASLDNISFQQGSFEGMNFDQRFDLVACSFGLFFVEDMAAALREFAAQVAPGGRLIISSFAVGAFSPFTESFAALYEKFGYEAPPPRWLRLSTEGLIGQLFKDAGVKAPHCTRHDFGFELASAESWWDIVWNAGYRGMLEAMEVEQLARFKKQHLSEVQDLINQGTNRLTVEVLISLSDIPGRD